MWKPPTPAVATAVTGAGAAPAAAASGASSTGSPVKGPSGKESEVIDLDSLEDSVCPGDGKTHRSPIYFSLCLSSSL